MESLLEITVGLFQIVWTQMENKGGRKTIEGERWDKKFKAKERIENKKEKNE